MKKGKNKKNPLTDWESLRLRLCRAYNYGNCGYIGERDVCTYYNDNQNLKIHNNDTGFYTLKYEDTIKDTLITIITSDLDMIEMAVKLFSYSHVNRINSLVKNNDIEEIIRIGKIRPELYDNPYIINNVFNYEHHNILFDAGVLIDNMVKNCSRYYLSNKQLETIPEYVFRGNYVGYVVLSGNRFTNINDINKLPFLWYLDLSDNKLMDLPELNLQKLETLKLSGNNLTNFEQKNLTILKKLDLSNNPNLKNISIRKTRLECLDIRGTDITEFNEYDIKNLHDQRAKIHLYCDLDKIDKHYLKYLHKKYYAFCYNVNEMFIESL